MNEETKLHKSGVSIREGDTLRCRLFYGDSYTSDFPVIRNKKTLELEVNGYPVDLYDEVQVLNPTPITQDD